MYDSQMICFSHCVAVGKQIRRQSGGEDVELRKMHPTMSSSQMVVGTVFSGMFTKLMKAYKQILMYAPRWLPVCSLCAANFVGFYSFGR